MCVDVFVDGDVCVCVWMCVCVCVCVCANSAVQHSRFGGPLSTLTFFSAISLYSKAIFSINSGSPQMSR